MIQALVLILVGVAAWKQFAPAGVFIRGFASLLARPERGRPGLRGWLTLSEFVGGEHEGRPVTLVLHPKRGHRLGYLTLGMATASTQAWSGSKATHGPAVSTPRRREALDVLIGRHGLTLELDAGWLRATWMPVGFFIFPGRFDAEKWREVLTHMQMLAVDLEGAEKARRSAGPILMSPAPRMH